MIGLEKKLLRSVHKIVQDLKTNLYLQYSGKVYLVRLFENINYCAIHVKIHLIGQENGIRIPCEI
ncbi:Histone-fold domain-containing protein [Strongyloides ratti]|uniref:Histone-fold domain-containing protein n=1 Tax=Strongyloides ratti TaxID=34506 RepID=A0A090LGZ0_STRRB|nr:Histone-fold domain-containing protein [Strongyloides ratti]CEF66730.1 Histone-fold domain-containing protein [Strongyloides ratti]